MKTILILDDIFENLYFLRVILEKAGYAVVEAKDGKEGLDKLHKNSIDLIISDILMPVMDGYMFCQACKKEKLFENIPFVFYTSTYTQKSDEDFALKLGANHFLRKPTDPDVILQLVQDLLAESKPKLKPAKKVQFTEKEVLRLYSKRLISKLEQKNLDLEKEVLERKKAEQLLINKNEVLDLIAVNTPLDKIFDRLLLNYESVHPNYFGSLSLLDADGKHLNLVSAPSMPKPYNSALKGIVIGENVGSCGTAAFTKKPVIVSDISKDKLWVDYKDLALKYNLMSCWSLPIISKNKDVLGTFAIYSKSISAPSLEDIRELKLAVSLTSIVIEKSRNVAEIKKKDESYRALIDQASDAIVTYSLDGTIHDFNIAAYRNLGYTKAEFLKFKIQDFSIGELIKIQDNHNKLLNGKSVIFDRQFIHKNGTILEVQVSAKLQEDGKVVGIARDVTEWQNNLKEIKKAKKDLEEIAKKSLVRKNVIIELASLVGSDYKKALRKITSLSAQTINVERVSILKFNNLRTEIYCENLYTQKDKNYQSGLVLKKEGNEAYFNTLSENRIINATDALNNKITKGFAKDYLLPFNIKSKLSIPIQGVNEVYGILCFEQVDTKHDWNSEEEEFATSIANLVSLMVESSERKAAEKELKSEKEFSENLITSLQEGLSVVDLNGKHIKVNAALCKMTGFTEEELLGVKAPFPYWAPEEYDNIYEAFNNPLKGLGKNKEFTLMRKNGERFPASLSDSVIKNKEGEIVAYFSTIIDITIRVKVENILKENIRISDQRKNTIIELASLIGDDFNSSLRKIAKTSAKALNVDMVTIWEFKTDKTELLSKLYYNVLEQSFIKDGLLIKKEDFPNYFNAFKDKNSINITDAINNPITKAFAKEYFSPNNTSSIMDVLIYGRKDHYGIISFECTTDKRVFTNEEESFVTSIASIVSLMVESFDRELAEKEAVIANRQLTLANKELIQLRTQLEQENVYLRNELDLVFNYEEMVYGSEEFGNVLTEIEKVAPTDATVLLIGESGTGKELLARAIHNIGARNNKPLIKINCSAIPRELLESELFGHKKGSFTGAISDKIGKFELADKGTLFLDEIGELPLDMQPKILRFLQEGEIEVVGGDGTKKLDVRVIAATNRNLKKQIKKKKFREDLYFRLNVFPIEIPPLSKRTDDIPLLVEHFVDKFNKAYNKNIKYITDEAMSKLKSYDWPGNIRELENLIERASILSTDETLLIPGFESANQNAKSINNKDLSLDAAQRNHILQVLEQCNWKISGADGAAELLKLKPSTLRDRMQKLDLKKATIN